MPLDTEAFGDARMKEVRERGSLGGHPWWRCFDGMDRAFG
jgi:hypothetical protein